jgi:hypothetical protein
MTDHNIGPTTGGLKTPCTKYEHLVSLCYLSKPLIQWIEGEFQETAVNVCYIYLPNFETACTVYCWNI